MPQLTEQQIAYSLILTLQNQIIELQQALEVQRQENEVQKKPARRPRTPPESS